MKKTRSNRQNWWCNQLMWIWVWELHNHGLVISSCEQFCIWVRRITLNRRKRTANGSGLFNAQTQRFQQHTIQSSSPRNILCVYKYMYTYICVEAKSCEHSCTKFYAILRKGLWFGHWRKRQGASLSEILRPTSASFASAKLGVGFIWWKKHLVMDNTEFHNRCSKKQNMIKIHRLNLHIATSFLLKNIPARDPKQCGGGVKW